MIEDAVPDILKALPTRICDVVKPWAARSPNQLALVEAEGAWTYRQLDSAVIETRTWLLECGVRPGDRVMIVCENCRAFVAVLLALAGLDAWPVLVNARLSAQEIDQIRDHCGARRVIYITSVSPHAREHAKRHGAVVREPGNLGPIGIGPLNEIVEPEPRDANGAERIAALIYTSGTTGLPKGVMLTHKNLLFIAAMSAKIRSLTPEDRLYGVLPMSHAVGLSVVLLGTLLSGATLYLSPRFNPMTARAALQKDQLTVVLGVPAMFGQLLEYARIRGLNSLKLPALRIVSSSGAPLHPAIKSAVENLFDLVLHNGYGVTECSPTIAQTRIEEPRTDTSVGRIFPGVEVKLVRPGCRLVTEGEVGELWVRGPNIMKGYYRAPEETSAAIDSEGWFNTRDLARLEDGNLFIVGRTKELIVRLGFNVYPAEVEAALSIHPAVARSAVIGQSIEGDEEIIAFVQPHPGSPLTAAELAEHAARHLASYKRPSHIFLIEEMPMTPTGKIAKGELAKIAAHSSSVS
ncbi:MAG TPA: class I adenylate-forming enzyme family protein [Candidatus Acidoferrales bacterium]|nr:class I adenylate-forming enzyme family protein [Candidatus Acidoferrales bacterium]